MRNSKKYLILLMSALIVALISPQVEATFSIVAVDTITGEVGSAGASCIAGAQIIKDVVEGIGAVNTQSFYLPGNQDNAHVLLVAGIAPDSIMDWLFANDVESDPSARQYGAVTLAGQGASASYTGPLCLDWKGHLTGPGYAIQGNILLGTQIIDSMEFEFLNTSGPLEERLMAALEAAKVPGADVRCLSVGKSAISAYIKVVRIGDGAEPYLDEVVNSTGGSTDPIDVLRGQYDNWKLRQKVHSDSSVVVISSDAIRADSNSTAEITIVPLNLDGDSLRYIDSVTISNTNGGTLSAVVDNGDKTFSTTINAGSLSEFDTVKVTVSAASETVQLASTPTVLYYNCGDLNIDFQPYNILDLNFLVNYIFRGGTLPSILDAADLDGSGGNPNILDLNILVNYIFRSGNAPDCGWPGQL
jgi:uncharacterized Ntn-hydrolase superfamily protein